MSHAEAATVEVEVVYALPAAAFCEHVVLPADSTVEDALAAVADRPGFNGVNLAELPVGIFGRQVDRVQQLRAGDRVEVYRPLEVDPRTARRQRVQQSR